MPPVRRLVNGGQPVVPIKKGVLRSVDVPIVDSIMLSKFGQDLQRSILSSGPVIYDERNKWFVERYERKGGVRNSVVWPLHEVSKDLELLTSWCHCANSVLLNNVTVSGYPHDYIRPEPSIGGSLAMLSTYYNIVDDINLYVGLAWRLMYRFAEWYCNTFRMQCRALLNDKLLGLEGYKINTVDNNGQTDKFFLGITGGWLPKHYRYRINSTLRYERCQRNYISVVIAEPAMKVSEAVEPPSYIDNYVLPGLENIDATTDVADKADGIDTGDGLDSINSVRPG